MGQLTGEQERVYSEACAWVLACLNAPTVDARAWALAQLWRVLCTGLDLEPEVTVSYDLPMDLPRYD